MSAPSKERHNKDKDNKQPPALWWETLDEECPITLEPLSSLPYPPFSLGGSSLFDGVALASYMVSRGMFENPLTREPLDYSDCKRLDDYVKTFHKQDTRMAVCCEAFTLSQKVKVANGSGDDGENERRARVLRSEAAAALCHLFVYGRTKRDPPPVAWNESEQRDQPNSFNLFSEQPRDDLAMSAMDGLRIIDDDEELVVQVEQQEWRQVQQAFPPLANGGDGIPPEAVTVDEHLLQTVKQTAEQTQRQEYERRRLLQQAQVRMIQEAMIRQEERKRARQVAKTVRQQEYEMERIKEDELERARAEIEQWRNEHFDRLLRESTRAQVEAKSRVDAAAANEVEPLKEKAPVVNPAQIEEERRQEQAARKKAKAAAKRRRAKERKKEQKEMEQSEAEKKQQIRLVQEKKAASAKKCDHCGDGILGYGFEKFGRSFCSTKCARAGVPLNT